MCMGASCTRKGLDTHHSARTLPKTSRRHPGQPGGFMNDSIKNVLKDLRVRGGWLPVEVDASLQTHSVRPNPMAFLNDLFKD